MVLNMINAGSVFLVLTYLDPAGVPRRLSQTRVVNILFAKLLVLVR